jgi:RNA polymerase sigma-70 factor (ECF subfamily)
MKRLAFLGPIRPVSVRSSAVANARQGTSRVGTSAPDRRLAARLTARDQAALTAAFTEHGAAVLGVARHVLRDESLAEDVTQEVFTFLWSHPERYNPSIGSLRSWLTMLSHRRSVDRVRREQRRSQTETRADQPSVVDLEVENHVATEWVCDRVRRALAELPAEQRDVLVRAYYGGRTYREVAGDLSIPEGTVKSRIRLGLKKLNDLLSADFANEDVPAWT